MGSVPGYERGCNIGAGNRVRVEESAVAAHATPRHVCKCVGVRALGTRAGGRGTAEETSLGSLGAGARLVCSKCTLLRRPLLRVGARNCVSDLGSLCLRHTVVNADIWITNRDGFERPLGLSFKPPTSFHLAYPHAAAIWQHLSGPSTVEQSVAWR